MTPSRPLFHSSFGLMLTTEQVVRAVAEFVAEEPNREYKIIVGSDSEKRPADKADFVTAIVVHRVGRGGRYFWRHLESGNIHTLRDRMWQEVLFSIELSKELVTLLKDAKLDKCAFEVHVDVGEHGATRAMIQELVGAVRANNFEARIKPNSFAASKVADRHV